VHMANMNLGASPEPQSPVVECHWTVAAMALSAISLIWLSFSLPGPLLSLVRQSAGILQAP